MTQRIKDRLSLSLAVVVTKQNRHQGPRCIHVLHARAIPNALFLATRVTFTDVIVINGALAIFLIITDRVLMMHYGVAQTIYYEKIDLIRADNRQELLADLSERTGQRVKRYIIEEIDFLRDTATLTVYFDDSAPPTSRRS